MRQCSAAGKVTVGLASHWPCVTDSAVGHVNGLSVYVIDGLRKADELPAYTLLLSMDSQESH